MIAHPRPWVGIFRRSSLRTLYLLRHAKARREPRDDDRERGLHRTGLRQSAALAAYLARLNRPVDRVLCSPSRRTRETLELILPALSGGPELRFPAELYLAGPDTLLRTVQATEAAVRALMLVGHNDGLHQFALALARSDELARLARFPTGALALFEFDIADWHALAPGIGRLAASVDPDELVGAA